jgi:addiction module HigA family antidote
MTKKEFAPVTPGEMLKEEFLAEYRLSQNRLAKALASRQTALPRSSTIVDALRQTLRSGSACTGNSPEFWMNLQSHYDLKMARSDLKPGDIKRIKAQRAA